MRETCSPVRPSLVCWMCVSPAEIIPGRLSGQPADKVGRELVDAAKHSGGQLEGLFLGLMLAARNRDHGSARGGRRPDAVAGVLDRGTRTRRDVEAAREL